MKTLGTILVMAFSLFTSCSKRSPDAQFWAWFAKNEDMLFHFERDQDKTFDALAGAMRKVHRDLTFEFGPDEGGKREFVISADGLKTGFPAVESLYASAPPLPRWTFIKFRPRREPMVLQMGELEIKPEDIEVSVEADGSKAGLTVLIKGFDSTREKDFSRAAFIMLDQAIGEYDMETKVGFITVKSFEETPQYRRQSLTNLPVMVDDFLKR